jgi:malonyl CoA-acyl carrier protein transacylase
MKTFVFPGQGSQAKGMGAALFEEFQELTQTADEILGYSIKELCLDDPRGELNRTQFTQPALYVVNALSYRKKTSAADSKPDFLAGHSLGELNALLAAECFDFATGLRIVRRRGELMSQVANGSMAAVLNATEAEIAAVLASNGLSNLDLANYNTPSQIVISGPTEEITRAEPLFQQGKMLYHRLNTSGAFHSRFMRQVQEEFREFLTGCEFAAPRIPVVANVTARPYQRELICDTLASQLASTVRWCESVQYLLAVAAARGDTMQFEEAGHGEVLTKLCNTIRRQTPAGVLSAITMEAPSQQPATPAPAAEAETPLDAHQKVARWNSTYPVGVRVKSLLADYANLETRTAAVVLFGHRPAVYMKGYNGYFDLDEIVPV